MDAIETRRLVLRQFTDDDAAFTVALLNDADFLRFIGDRGVRTPDDARRYIATGPAASYAQHGFGLLVVERRADRAPLGICGLLKRDALEHPDLGFAFVPAARGQGYAREAATAVLAWARETLGLARVLAIVSPDNAASLGLLESLGFRHERMVRMTDAEPEVRLLAVTLPPSSTAGPRTTA